MPLKTHLRPVLVIAVFFSNFCLRTYGQPDIVSTDCKIVAADIAEFPFLKNFLTYDQGEALSKKYYKYHKRQGRVHKRTGAVYLSREAILFLDMFFTDSANKETYKTLNIHFVNYNKKITSGQTDEKQTQLYFTPDSASTVDAMVRKPDYDTLLRFLNSKGMIKEKAQIAKAKVCPGFCDLSVVQRYPSSTGTSDGAGQDDIFFLSPGAAKELKRNYKYDIPKEAGHNQTEMVTVSRNVIIRLAHFLRANAVDDYPLVAVNFIRYSKKVISGQKNKRQTAISFAPVKKAGSSLQTDPCGYISWLKANPAKSNLPHPDGHDFGGENHGTLCPSICPEGEN